MGHGLSPEVHLHLRGGGGARREGPGAGGREVGGKAEPVGSWKPRKETVTSRRVHPRSEYKQSSVCSASFMGQARRQNFPCILPCTGCCGEPPTFPSGPTLPPPVAGSVDCRHPSSHTPPQGLGDAGFGGSDTPELSVASPEPGLQRQSAAFSTRAKDHGLPGRGWGGVICLLKSSDFSLGKRKPTDSLATLL